MGNFADLERILNAMSLCRRFLDKQKNLYFKPLGSISRNSIIGETFVGGRAACLRSKTTFTVAATRNDAAERQRDEGGVSILKKFAAEDRKALDGERAEKRKRGQPHCFRGVKGGLTANSRGC